MLIDPKDKSANDDADKHALLMQKEKACKKAKDNAVAAIERKKWQERNKGK